MGVSLAEQGRGLLLSLFLGLCLALLYDALRTLRLHRRHNRTWGGLLDMLYCLLLGLLLFAFSLRIGGGELRLYMLFSSFAGGVLYFLLLAPVLSSLWQFWTEVLFSALCLLRLPFRWLKSFYGKLSKLFKRLFLFCRNRPIIRRVEPIGGRRRFFGRKAKEKTQHSCAAGAAASVCHRRHPASASAGEDRSRRG